MNFNLTSVNLSKHSVHGQFLDLKTNNYSDIILTLLFLVFKLDKNQFQSTWIRKLLTGL